MFAISSLRAPVFDPHQRVPECIFRTAAADSTSERQRVESAVLLEVDLSEPKPLRPRRRSPQCTTRGRIRLLFACLCRHKNRLIVTEATVSGDSVVDGRFTRHESTCRRLKFPMPSALLDDFAIGLIRILKGPDGRNLLVACRCW